MIAPLLMAALLGGAAPTRFAEAFPAATTVPASAGGRLTSASSFEAAGLGATPEAAAREFLARHGATFGVGAGQKLHLRTAPAAGQVGPVRFERRVGGLPVFDGDIVVGVDARNAVVLVNTSDVPPRAQGRARLSRAAAVRAARAELANLRTDDTPRATRGWKAVGAVLRPVWRVDLVAAEPPGDWRSYVDAETGKVLLRTDLRVQAGDGGIAPAQIPKLP
jgi:Zn-dependent metalloprotease